MLEKIPWYIDAIFEPVTGHNILELLNHSLNVFGHKWIVEVRLLLITMVPNVTYQVAECIWFFCFAFFCRLHYFSNKKHVVLIRLFLWKNWDVNIWKNKTNIIKSIRVCKTIVIRNGRIIWKVVWIEYYLQLNLSSRTITRTQARSECIQCTDWTFWIIKSTVFFMWSAP